MNSSLAVRSKCHATKRPMRQFTETIFEAFFGGSRFSGKPTAPPPLQNWGQFSNFPASPLVLNICGPVRSKLFLRAGDLAPSRVRVSGWVARLELRFSISIFAFLMTVKFYQLKCFLQRRLISKGISKRRLKFRSQIWQKPLFATLARVCEHLESLLMSAWHWCFSVISLILLLYSAFEILSEFGHMVVLNLFH